MQTKLRRTRLRRSASVQLGKQRRRLMCAMRRRELGSEATTPERPAQASNRPEWQPTQQPHWPYDVNAGQGVCK